MWESARSSTTDGETRRRKQTATAEMKSTAAAAGRRSRLVVTDRGRRTRVFVVFGDRGGWVRQRTRSEYLHGFLVSGFGF
jgi:hypothetical protein